MAYGNQKEGIDTDNADGIEIKYCNIYSNGHLNPDFPGISIGSGTENAKVYYCLIYSNKNDGITVESFGSNVGTKIFNCVFYGNGLRNIYYV